MDKKQLIRILTDLGVTTSNCFTKMSFIKDYEEYVGLFPNELVDDFYFYNEFDKKIYVIWKMPKREIEKLPVDNFKGRKKLLVLLSDCRLIKNMSVDEEEPIVKVKEEKDVAKQYVNSYKPTIDMDDLPDLNMQEMTMRRFACIHLAVPETDLPWLNEIIAKSKK